MEGLSPGEREPLTGKLLDLYRNDPDSGIHGAAEWTLRQWKQQEKLKELDAELMKVKDRGERRWFVNGQGQTFAVIEGPVEFRMGSPPTEPERYAGRDPQRMRIPRRFAIATKEVTVEQFQRFLKLGGITIDRYQLSASVPQQVQPRSRRTVDRSRLVHGGSLLQLAERAGGFAQGPVVLPPQRGRSLRRGDVDPGRRSRAHGLSAAHRGGMGIRLPGRYGHQPVLRSLDRPAGRLCAVSGQQPGACLDGREPATQRPGIVRHAGERSVNGVRTTGVLSKPRQKGAYNDVLTSSESIGNKSNRLYRGGAFEYPPEFLRSAERDAEPAVAQESNKGFRPTRTYH